MDKPTFLPRLAKTVIPGCSTRNRRVNSIIKLKQPDERGIAYHGCVNCTYDGELCFTVVGATSLESAIWYDINIPGLMYLILLNEQGGR